MKSHLIHSLKQMLKNLEESLSQYLMPEEVLPIVLQSRRLRMP